MPPDLERERVTGQKKTESSKGEIRAGADPSPLSPSFSLPFARSRTEAALFSLLARRPTARLLSAANLGERRGEARRGERKNRVAAGKEEIGFGIREGGREGERGPARSLANRIGELIESINGRSGERRREGVSVAAAASVEPPTRNDAPWFAPTVVSTSNRYRCHPRHRHFISRQALFSPPPPPPPPPEPPIFTAGNRI